MKQITLSFLIVVVGFISNSVGVAQTISQEVLLKPGWNSVYLNVQPEPRDIETVFQEVDIVSVWTWNDVYSSVQFVQNPTELLPDDPKWLNYFAPGLYDPQMNNLHVIQGGRAYLIEYGGDTDFTWVVRGKPLLSQTEWRSDTFNLVGFSVDDTLPPTFEEFFADSTAHQDLRVYSLGDNDQWIQLTALSFEPIEPGTAYWIYAQTASDFTGPIEVELDQRQGLHYGEDVVEQTLTLRNASSYSKTFTLELLPSEPPPAGAPALAGTVPLAYWKVGLDDTGSLLSAWEPITASLQRELSANEAWTLRLEVQRDAMNPTSTNESYQSLLRITDSEGSEHLISVSAQKPDPAQGASARAGLWVGTAVLNQVSEPNNPNTPNLPIPTATEASLQLIIHVDADGNTKLLQQVTLMWQEATNEAPGRYVLVTNDDQLSDYTGSALRDGQPVGRRISSVAFALNSPLEMTGDFGLGSVTTTLTVDDDAALNPFLHSYHPDHDNLNARYKIAYFEENDPDDPDDDEVLYLDPNSETLPEPKESFTSALTPRESFTFHRDLTLTFTANDPEGLDLPGWGDTMLGGTYKEVLRGVHRKNIQTQGSFRIRHVSPVATLIE